MSHDSKNLDSNSPAPLDQPASKLREQNGPPLPVSRRHFLEAAGFSLTLATVAGCRRPEEKTARPLAEEIEGYVPGQIRYFASTCAGCSAACGMLVSTRDGRPLKMEGNPEHPISQGALCAVGQATTMGLYDQQRFAGPLQGGKPAEWPDVDKAIGVALKKVKDSSQGVRLVTSTVTSPTLQATIDTFLSQFSNSRHVVLDAVSSSAILDAHEKTHSARVLPHYLLDRAKVIASFGADFLGSWISPVEFTAAWRKGRVPTEDHKEMSYHVQFESRMSLTGGNADRRIRIRPEDQAALVSQLADKVAKLAGSPPAKPLAVESFEPIKDQGKVLEHLAGELWKHRGQSLVLCDSQDTSVQVLVNYLNHLLGNYGKTLDVERPSRQRQGNDREVTRLLEELTKGEVGALLVASADLVHSHPGLDPISDVVSAVPLVVSFAEREDEFASAAQFVCPDHHPLESWSDAEPISGWVSLAQPTLNPLKNTRSVMESLAAWSGQSDKSAYDLVRETWKGKILERQKKVNSFRQFWDQSLHDGFVEVDPELAAVGEFRTAAVKPLDSQPKPEGFSVTLYNKVAMPEVRHAHNPWLQELPDPVTKVTWGNYVCISPDTAAELNLTDGDVVQVEAQKGGVSLELPAVIQPGQHDHALAIALFYGCQGTDRFAGVGPQWLEARPTVAPGELVGKNAAGFVTYRDGAVQYVRDGVALTKTGRRHELATTQDHHAIEVPPEVAPYGAEEREIVQRTTLSAFREDSHAGAPEHHDFGPPLWAEDHPKTGHHWGMVIDLNACSGCSACMIACQVENNVPVVGADEVRRHREMHWIRLDRYYSGEGDDVDVAHQPMMCQHCDKAPCETVCPVLATVHSDEGLNEQAYNRCVGTRYCANNCPYKVRRFNWFKYAHEDSVQNLLLNPDVTVRSRGVMEKCSMCVQRIEDGRIEARAHGHKLQDGDVQTACQQSCPANAIVFGDMNDPESEISKVLKGPRRYGVLEEMDVRPSVNYLRVVRNDNDVMKNRDVNPDGEPKRG